MTTSTLSQSVLAETISRDQLTQLAAVMLGLVVFAAIFALVERQRSRRGKDQRDAEAPTVDSSRSAPPPRYVSDAPAVAITTAPPAPPTPAVLPDDLPVPFVPRAHEPAGQGHAPGPKTPAAAPAPVPPSQAGGSEPTGPSHEGLPDFPTAEPGPGPTPPASPDEIGIILPDDPSPGSGGTEPRR